MVFRATLEQNQTPQSCKKQSPVRSPCLCPGNQLQFGTMPDISVPTAKSLLQHEVVLDYVAVSSCTRCPWSCSVNRWQMLFREDKHRIMNLGGDNKETEHLLHERVLQPTPTQGGRLRRYCRNIRKTFNSQKTANRMLALLIQRHILNQEWQV